MEPLDNTAWRILQALQQNGRMSDAELARAVDMSPSAVTERVRRLEASGVVTAALAEAGMPDTDGLGRDAELAGDLGLAHASGEQLGRAQPAGFEPVAFKLCRRAARDRWHAGSSPAEQQGANSALAPLNPTSNSL